MNRLLATGLRALNAVAALAIIILTTQFIVGMGLKESHNGSGEVLVFLLVGLISGLLLAVIINGAIALLIQIERHLKAIRDSLESAGPPSGRAHRGDRRDPEFDRPHDLPQVGRASRK